MLAARKEQIVKPCTKATSYSMVVRLFLCLAGAKLAPFLEQSARNTQFIEI